MRYDLELATPDREWQGLARLRLGSGEVSWEVSCPEETPGATAERPPEWLTTHLVAALRSAWRGLEQPTRARLEDLPRRLTRWRAPLPGQGSTPA